MARPRKSKWSWDPLKDEAAVLIAAAEISNARIAKEINISESTLYEWIAVPDFAARVDEMRVRIREQIVQRGIAVVENRVARKQADWERLRQIQSDRADSHRGSDVYPGIDTGLIIHDQKGIGSGDNFEIIDVYRVDTALLSELHRLEESVAAELGQRVTKTEVETRDTSIGEELVAKLESLAKRHTAKDAAPSEVQDVSA